MVEHIDRRPTDFARINRLTAVDRLREVIHLPPRVLAMSELQESAALRTLFEIFGTKPNPIEVNAIEIVLKLCHKLIDIIVRFKCQKFVRINKKKPFCFVLVIFKKMDPAGRLLTLKWDVMKGHKRIFTFDVRPELLVHLDRVVVIAIYICVIETY